MPRVYPRTSKCVSMKYILGPEYHGVLTHLEYTLVETHLYICTIGIHIRIGGTCCQLNYFPAMRDKFCRINSSEIHGISKIGI